MAGHDGIAAALTELILGNNAAHNNRISPIAAYKSVVATSPIEAVVAQPTIYLVVADSTVDRIVPVSSNGGYTGYCGEVI